MTAFSATRTRARSDYRVVLVDQHTLFVDSMQRTLSIEGYDARSVSHLRAGHCPDALLSEVRAMKPRLVLVDLDLGPAVDGLQIITPLARDRVDVVVVTANPDRARWGEAVRGGARKVLSKSRPLQETLAVVRRLHQGLAVQTVGERQELLRARREATVRTHVTAILDTLEVSSQPTAIGLAHASAPFSDPVGKLSQNMPDMRHEPPRVPA